MSQEAAIQLEQYNLFLLRHLIAGIFCFSIFSIVVMYSYNQGHTQVMLFWFSCSALLFLGFNMFG